jgi:hypothetical protein
VGDAASQPAPLNALASTIPRGGRGGGSWFPLVERGR